MGLSKTSRNRPGDEQLRRTIDELIDTGVPAVAAHSTGRGPRGWSALLYVAIPLIAIALVANLRVQESSSAQTDETASQGGIAMTDVTAENIAFDTERIVLEADTTAAVHFTNADPSTTNHNVAVYTDDTASEAIFQGKIISGGSDIDYSFDTPKRGQYYFQCDVHPGMNGTVVTR